MLKRILLVIFTIGLLSSCGSQTVVLQESKDKSPIQKGQQFEMKSSTLAVEVKSDEVKDSTATPANNIATITVVNCKEALAEDSSAVSHPVATSTNQDLKLNPNTETSGNHPIATLTETLLAKNNKGTKGMRTKKGLKKLQRVKDIKKTIKEGKKKDGIGSLIYIILVVLLILLLLRLLSVLAGPIFDILILVLVIFLVGRLLGLW